jgi:hypothetical protein
VIEIPAAGHDLPGRFFVRMRVVLRLVALFLALVALVLWLFGGPNTGRTKTTEMVKSSDLMTGREIVSWETRFLPGLDFLGAGMLGAAAVFGTSFLVRRP